MAGTGTAGALDGLRVLDMSRIVAGPLAGQMLADLGADVVKLERPGEGDDSRRVAPPWLTDRAGARTDQSTMHLTVNRNKRSIAVDFTTPAGRGLVRRLAGRADVLIENYRAGTLARHGLGYADLAALNPGLVYCSITGFGQTGPYARRPGYDYLIQAMSGLMSVTGHPGEGPGGGPLRVGVPISDILAGMNATIGILAALERRRTSGRGQQVDVALLDSQVAALLNHAAAYLNGAGEPARTGNEHPSGTPYGVFRCADAHILVAVVSDREFARFAGALERPEWTEDPRFARNVARVENREALRAEIEAVLAGAPAAHWLARLDAAEVPSGPINSLAQVFADAQVQARGTVVTLPHPLAGEVRLVANPVRLSETPASYRAAPPLAGADTEAVLADWLGLAAAAIDELRAAGAL